VDEAVNELVPDSADGPLAMARLAGAVRQTGSGTAPADRLDHPGNGLGQVSGSPSPGLDDSDVNAAAVAAYRTSVRSGEPLSERMLAGMFGKTSRRWARNRMAEARQDPAAA
jgi:hypothetical protein